MPGARKISTTGPARLSYLHPRTTTSAWNDSLRPYRVVAVGYQLSYCVRRALASGRELHYTPGLCGATNLVSAGALYLDHHLARVFHEDSPMAACSEWRWSADAVDH